MTDERLPIATQDDAREGFDELAQAAGTAPIAYESLVRPGEIINHPQVVRGPNMRFRHVKAAPPLTPTEQTQAANTLNELMGTLETDYPFLTEALLNHPDSLFLLPEVQLMLQSPGTSTSHNLTADIVDSILQDPVAGGTLATYQKDTSQNQTQKLFWRDVGDLYDTNTRQAFITLLSQLTEDGANNIASLAMAWAEQRDMEDEENRAQLLVNMWQWTYARNQSELGDEGFWAILDAPQEFVEDVIVRPFVDATIATLGSPEEAARRKGLTLGQQAAYQFGIRPPDEAGQMGMWNNVSGVIDAYSELGLDPLNVLAGAGAGLAAVKTIPIANKATKAGRLFMAGRALLPKVAAGAANVKGGRVARFVYAFKAKTYDDLLDGLAKNGVAQDIARLVKANNVAKLSERYPQFGRMSDDMWDAINITETPEEVVEVLRHGNLIDAMKNGDDLAQAELEAAQAWSDYRKAAGERLGLKIGAHEDISDVLPKGKDLLGLPAEHRGLLLEAVNKQIRYDTLLARPSEAFIIADIPRRAKAISWTKTLRGISGDGRFKTGVRQLVARATPGRIPDEINLFSTRKGMTDIRNFLAHYGVSQGRIDDLVNEFVDLDLGARQDWFFNRVLGELGEATGVPVLSFDLKQFYKKGGVRSFSASGEDLFTDFAGRTHRGPLLPSHMNATIPIPVKEIDQIVRRARAIGNRSKIANALGMKGRGLFGTTKSHRAQLVTRFRRALEAKGEDLSKISDEQLWHMAYSYVDPGGIDGRGWVAGTALPKLGSSWDQLHRFFTKSMLMFRPQQWLWRVGLIEEPIRAAIFNLPSFYRNPLAYMGDARTAHYLSRLGRWREANLTWADEAYRTLTTGINTVEDGVARLRTAGLFDDIFDEAPRTLGDLRTGISEFLEGATRDRTRLNKLNPIKKVGWAVNRRSAKIAKAEAKLEALGLPTNFDLLDDVQEIQQKLTNVYLAGAVGASDVRPAQWERGMLDSQARNYGQTYAQKLVEIVEDPMGNRAVRRYAALLRGDTPDGTTSAAAIVEHSAWQMMRSDIQLRYPSIDGDLALADKYMDDLLGTEVRTLFAPFLEGKTLDEQAEILDTFARRRRLNTQVDGVDIDIDFSSRNVGAASRQLGERMVDLRNSDLPIPEKIPAPSFDPRFMANGDGVLKRLGDMVLQTFGEKASQAINRRPAWVAEYRRWARNYEKIGVPSEIAAKLAREHASLMVNRVYYNIDEAPFLVEKLNRFVPFFGATYEVMSTWTYKMPAEVGGSWPLGVGEFGRKFRRLMDALVNLGIVTREQDDDGTVNHILYLTPSEGVNEIGDFLRGMGFKAINTAESTIATLLSMENGLGLRDNGYRLSVGDPLDFTDYGILSFANANLGLSPTANFLLTKAAALYPGAADSQRTATAEGESFADLAERLDVEVTELARLNRGVFFDTVGKNTYLGLMAGLVLPTDVVLPSGLAIEIPATDLWTTAIQDFFAPFGSIEDPKDLLTSWVPGVMRYALMGIGLQNQPTDAFYQGEFEGLFAGLIPETNLSQMSSQLSEAFMYVESHRRYPGGEGRFERILRKEKELAAMSPGAEADELREEIDIESEEFLTLVQKTAQESLFLRSITGQMLPTSPGHVRQQHELIQSFWNSADYADSRRIGDGDLTIQPFQSMEEVENFFGLVSAWLEDPTGDSAKAQFRETYPTIFPYLTPKTYWADNGTPPEIWSFEEHQDAVNRGDKIVAPLHVTMNRAQSAAIQADFYNQLVARYGKDPQKAAAAALADREGYSELQEQRDLAYQALNMRDDMYGNVYAEWREARYPGDSWSLEQATEHLRTIQDNLGLLFELEDQIDVEIDLEGIKGLGTSMRAAISEISGAIKQYESLADNQDFDRNPYEAAIHQYFEDIYLPFKEQEATMYEELGLMTDSEQVSLQYERIKLLKQDAVNRTYYLNGDTTTPFPSPLDYRWAGYDEETRAIKSQQWLTRPVEWMDLDQAQRIIDRNPIMAEFLPSDQAEFEIYRDWTVQKLNIDEALEDNTITSGEATKMRKAVEQEVQARLIALGRTGEVAFMSMTPYERLETSGELPASLGIFGDYVRYYQEILASREISAGTIEGRQIVAPLYEMARAQAYSDAQVMDDIVTLGANLYDKTNLDQILPWLFFDSRSEF